MKRALSVTFPDNTFDDTRTVLPIQDRVVQFVFDWFNANVIKHSRNVASYKIPRKNTVYLYANFEQMMIIDESVQNTKVRYTTAIYNLFLGMEIVC